MEILSRRLDFEPRCGILPIRQGEPKCQTNRRLQRLTENSRPTSLLHMSAYVRRNQVASNQLATLISTVYQALASLDKPAAETGDERVPAVPIRRSVHRDHVVCLECGWRGQMLRRHLDTGHGLSVDQYRARWNLPHEHPMTAPSYSERRSGLAKQFGRGRLGTGSRTTAAQKTPTPRRRPGDHER